MIAIKIRIRAILPMIVGLGFILPKVYGATNLINGKLRVMDNAALHGTMLITNTAASNAIMRIDIPATFKRVQPQGDIAMDYTEPDW